MSESRPAYSVSAGLDSHYELLTTIMREGDLVFFLGAGANLCALPSDWGWTPEQREYLPSARELALYLESLCYASDERRRDLTLIAQCVSMNAGQGALYRKLRKIFDADYALTPLHTFLATRPAALRAAGADACHQVIMTSNYDDLMERAFEAAGEPYDVLVYMVEHGRFLHRTPDGENVLVDRANEYNGIPFDANQRLQRPLIVKLHGAVDRRSLDGDSYVITEDDYIYYLSRDPQSAIMPQGVRAKLAHSHFLFLGYGLRDWNLRVILHRIWDEQWLEYKSWAVLLDRSDLEEKFWSKRNVEILVVPLLSYIGGWAEHWQGAAAGSGRVR